jgi:hypothetical protein
MLSMESKEHFLGGCFLFKNGRKSLVPIIKISSENKGLALRYAAPNPFTELHYLG